MLAENELEPLILADGRRIDPATGKAIKQPVSAGYVEVPSGREAQEIIVRARKSVAELPLPPEQLSGVAFVAFYTLFGLPDIEISLASNDRLTVTQIENIRELDAYKDFMQAAKDNILNTATDQVRDVFQKHAKQAASKIVELATNADGNEVLAFKASQDILDRAGHRPADIVEHRHVMEDALQIVITRRDETQKIPTLEGNFSVVEPDDANSC